MPADEKPAKKPWSRLGAERTGSNIRFQPTRPLAAVQRLSAAIVGVPVLGRPPWRFRRVGPKQELGVQVQEE